MATWKDSLTAARKAIDKALLAADQEAMDDTGRPGRRVLDATKEAAQHIKEFADHESQEKKGHGKKHHGHADD